VGVAGDAEEALAALREARAMGAPFDVLVTDLIMQPHDGLWLIEQLRPSAFDPESLDVVLVSQQDEARLKREDIEKARQQWQGLSSRDMGIVLRAEVIDQLPAVNQQSEEAHEAAFLEAVWSGIWTKLEESVQRELAAAYPAAIQDANDWRKTFITQDAALVAQIESLLQYAAPTTVPILILGLSGTGKNDLAKLIHARSPRRDKPFVELNVDSLVLESQVFGHVKGAFTGAVKDQKGLIELAEGGTLFVNEIGEFPLDWQVKLLRALQDKVIWPLGAAKACPVDFRLIAATNIPLEVALREGTLREDLYYRIAEEPITLPPLKHRRSDIPALITHFWSKTEEGEAGRT
jgi:transcriptional regulator with PAS, ATPase and Fis domain